jgi:hypothetical protein
VYLCTACNTNESISYDYLCVVAGFRNVRSKQTLQRPWKQHQHLHNIATCGMNI